MNNDEQRVIETEAREFAHYAKQAQIRGAKGEARALGQVLLNNPTQDTYVRYRVAVNQVAALLNVPFSQAVTEIWAAK